MVLLRLVKKMSKRLRKKLLKKPVKDIKLSEIQSFKELIDAMYESGGFTAKKLAQATKILIEMFKDRDCTRILAFPACILATGTRGIITDVIKRKLFDVVITTCGSLDHDLARSFKDYYHGYFEADDEMLHKLGINRLGNVFLPNESYGIIIEKEMDKILSIIIKDKKITKLSTRELCWIMGEHISDESSFLYWAWKNKIPVFIPGITDGAVGWHIWRYSQLNNIAIDILKDEQELSDMIFESKKLGALIIGGGISKHHTIWWSQFKDGLDYAVYITTAVEWDGSLSGARPREAVSWGKINVKAKKAVVECDATIALPLMFAAIFEELNL